MTTASQAKRLRQNGWASRSERVADQIRQQIANGRYRQGAILPSRKLLAEEYEVAPMTIEQAVKRLIGEGILRAENGRGTFVTGVPPTGQKQAHSYGPSEPLAPTVPQLTQRIGIVLNHLPNSWEEIVLHGAESVFSKHGIIAIPSWRIGNAHVDLPVGEQSVRMLSDGCSAVLVLAVAMSNFSINDVFREVGGMDAPLVFVTSFDVDQPICYSHYSSHDAGFQAASHLLAKGWDRLAYVTHYGEPWSLDRLRGVRLAVESRSGSRDELPVVDLNYQPFDPTIHAHQFYYARGVEAGRLLFERWPGVNGIVAANDLLAIGIMDAAAAAGQVAGRDFGIVGFDDVDNKARDHGLTSLRPPLAELGEEAAMLCVDLVHGKPKSRSVSLLSHITIRESTCKDIGCASIG
ncbi:MAG: GntR family transcriptional regulator [Capsulimonadaceae bacterium]|nr:GntR family transcriptional regulator [Capsulimonadaceae bacterium]